ncbi:mCG3338, partial [Mus musculus]
FWNVTFDPEDTFLGNFTLDRKRTVNVPMMKTEELTTNYFRDEEMQSTVMELNYIGNASFLFILPDQGRIQHVEDSLQPQSLRKWRKSLRPRMLDELSLPKFSLSQDYNLNDILPELGIKEVFSTQADLSGITGAKNIRVSQMIHQAALDVTETHTEADVITIARYNFQSAKIKAKIVKVDREFLYLILDPMFKSISVMGKVINPLTN